MMPGLTASLGEEKAGGNPLLLFLLSLRMKRTLSGFLETISHPCLLHLLSGSDDRNLSLKGQNSAKKEQEGISGQTVALKCQSYHTLSMAFFF